MVSNKGESSNHINLYQLLFNNIKQHYNIMKKKKKSIESRKTWSIFPDVINLLCDTGHIFLSLSFPSCGVKIRITVIQDCYWLKFYKMQTFFFSPKNLSILWKYNSNMKYTFNQHYSQVYIFLVSPSSQTTLTQKSILQI